MEHPSLVRHEIELEGARVRYAVAGEGPPVALVHGLAGSTRWWNENVGALASRYRVHLVDLPGGVDLARTPEWVRAWLEGVGAAPVALVGHSLGGLVCARVAARWPHLVRQLVLVAPAGVPAGRRLVGYVGPLATTARRSSPRFLRVLAADALRAGPRRLLRTSRDLLADDLRADLRSVTVPTLVVWGEHDELVPRAHAHVFERELANARLVVIPGARHVPMVERPREFEDALLSFLD